MHESTSRPKRTVDIVVRDPVFDDFSELPKRWAMNNRLVTFSHGVFSVIITEGERFFIRSVNVFREEIEDPALLEELDLFSRQEAMHTRQHVAFNDAIRKFGFDVDRIERNTRRFMRLLEKCLTRRAALAVTVFLEHLTTMLAETGYRFPEFRTEWDRRARDFWTWHGLEELEHKAVAFDVFERVGGGYLTRVSAALMLLVVIALLPLTLVGDWVRFARYPSDKPARTLSDTFRQNPTLRRRTLGFFLGYLFTYFKPGFHPWNNDSRDHVERWLAEINPTLETAKTPTPSS